MTKQKPNQTTTLRDQLAMCCLNALIAQGDDCSIDEIARDAYLIADACLKAREDKKP